MDEPGSGTATATKPDKNASPAFPTAIPKPKTPLLTPTPAAKPAAPVTASSEDAAVAAYLATKAAADAQTKAGAAKLSAKEQIQALLWQKRALGVITPDQFKALNAYFSDLGDSNGPLAQAELGKLQEQSAQQSDPYLKQLVADLAPEAKAKTPAEKAQAVVQQYADKFLMTGQERSALQTKVSSLLANNGTPSADDFDSAFVEVLTPGANATFESAWNATYADLKPLPDPLRPMTTRESKMWDILAEDLATAKVTQKGEYLAGYLQNLNTLNEVTLDGASVRDGVLQARDGLAIDAVGRARAKTLGDLAPDAILNDANRFAAANNETARLAIQQNITQKSGFYDALSPLLDGLRDEARKTRDTVKRDALERAITALQRQAPSLLNDYLLRAVPAGQSASQFLDATVPSIVSGADPSLRATMGPSALGAVDAAIAPTAAETAAADAKTATTAAATKKKDFHGKVLANPLGTNGKPLWSQQQMADAAAGTLPENALPEGNISDAVKAAFQQRQQTAQESGIPFAHTLQTFNDLVQGNRGKPTGAVDPNTGERVYQLNEQQALIAADAQWSSLHLNDTRMTPDQLKALAIRAKTGDWVTSDADLARGVAPKPLAGQGASAVLPAPVVPPGAPSVATPAATGGTPPLGGPARGPNGVILAPGEVPYVGKPSTPGGITPKTKEEEAVIAATGAAIAKNDKELKELEANGGLP